MTLPSADKIEASAHVLRHEIEKLDGLGLTFAASLVRIAHLDLQMRLYKVTEEEIDVLSFAARVVEQEQQSRNGTNDGAQSGAPEPTKRTA